MEKKSFDELETVERDIITELGNIGIGNAATSMAAMLSSKLTIDFTKVLALDFDEIANMMGGPETLTVGVLSLFEGDAEGMFLFVLEKAQADNLINILLKTEGPIDFYEHMHFSAIKEIGNIIEGTYLTALEALTGLSLKLSPPQVCIDMAGAILSVPVIEFGQTGDKGFLVKSGFKDVEKDIDGHLLMVSSVDSYQKMCQVLKLKM